MSQDIKKLILKHDGAAPRYTSYPPATMFSPAQAAANHENWLSALRDDAGISLYVHIPFCARLCYYCGCHTTITHKEEDIDRYLDLLRREAVLIAARLPKGSQIRQLHFGGGSPSMLSPGRFEALVEMLRQTLPFAPAAPIAVEADPRHMSEALVQSYARAGVTRISFGVQDFNQDVLRNVNRVQPEHLTVRALQWCREQGITDINFDLMYGLPGQTADSIAVTAERAAILAPGRIAFFGYAHVPWMKKHMHMLSIPELPDAAARYDLFYSGRQVFEAAGYRMIGIDHFVRERDSMFAAFSAGSLRRNFQGYTVDSSTALLGLGSSSISRLPEGYAQNTTDMRHYTAAITSGKLAVARGYRLTGEDRLYGAAIEALMCYMQLDIGAFAAAFRINEAVLQPCLARLQPFIEDGLVTLENGVIRILPGAELIARAVARAFDQYAEEIPLQNRHSRTV